MPSRRDRPSRGRTALLAGAALLLICSAALWSLVAAPMLARAQAARALERAQARWEAHAISDYRIAIDLPSIYLPCRCVAEVRADRPVAVDMSRCYVGLEPPPEPTVPAMFAAAAEMIHAAERLNSLIVRATVEISYDPQLGYPQAAALRVETIERPLLSLLLSAPPSIELNSYSWQITELTPLPGP